MIRTRCVSRLSCSLLVYMYLSMNVNGQSMAPQGPDRASREIAAPEYSTLRAKRIEIVDDDGNARIILRVLELKDMTTAAVILFDDETKRTRLSLGAGSSFSGVSLISTDGERIASLEEADGEGLLYILMDPKSKSGAEISARGLGPELCLGKLDTCSVSVVASTKEEESSFLTNISKLSMESRFGAMETRVAQLESRLSRGESEGRVIESYYGVGIKQFIEDKTGAGNVIILSDGSIWEVFSLDRINSHLWMPTDDVMIVNSTIPSSVYRHQMINLDEGQKVNVSYLGSK